MENTVEQLHKEIERLQKDLLQNEQYKQMQLTLLNTIPHGVCEVDLKGNFVYANESNHKILGYKNGELLGKSVQSVLPADEKPRFISFVKNIATGKENENPWIGKNLKKNKEEIFVQVDWNYKLSEAGNVLGYIGIITDITGRKLTEEALKTSEEKYRRLVNNLKDIIWSTDMKFNSTYISSSILAFTGYTPEEYFQIPLVEMLIPESWRLVEDTFNIEYARLLQGTIDVKNFSRVLELGYMHKNGSIVWGEVNISITTDEFGDMVGLHGVTRDVTESRKIHTELVEAMLKAESADKLKSTFLANMSHEIRTPMNGIIGFADLLKLPETTQEQRNEYHEYIRISCNILLQLIDDIIDLARIEAGEMTISHETFRLYPLLLQRYEFFEQEKCRHEKENVEFVMSVDSAMKESYVYVDPVRLEQILNNLLSNALKFTEKGQVELGCSPQENGVLFFVKDTGIGIAHEQTETIFERFRQLDYMPEKRKYGGTGLGLTISKNLVQLLNGKIWVESEEGKGSAFYFYIPDIITEKKEDDEYIVEDFITKQEEKQIGIYDWSEKVILIVEDDDLNFKFMQSALFSTNAAILWATDGKDAVETCKSIPNIDLVLMDIQLPIMDGFEATKLIKSFRPDLPIIAQTAVVMVDKRKKVLAVGCSDYLTKPILPDDLLKKISEYL